MSEPEYKITRIPSGPGRNVIPAADAAAWKQGYAFIAAAKARGRENLRAARREARAMREQGYRDGRDSGIAASTKLLIQTSRQVDAYVKSAEGELIKLAMSIVQQVLGEFDANEVIGRAAATALKSFSREKLVRVSVHPDREEGVRSVLGALDHDDLPDAIMVVPDPALGLEDCLVATDIATINAGVDAQLKAIAAAFKDVQVAEEEQYLPEAESAPASEQPVMDPAYDSSSEQHETRQEALS
jgi:type III secretion protein L